MNPIAQALVNYGIEQVYGMFSKEDVDKELEKMTGGGIKGNSFINKFTGGQGLTGILKNQGKKFVGNQALKAITGGGTALLPFAGITGLAMLGNKYRKQLTGYDTQQGYEDARNKRRADNRLSYITDRMNAGKNYGNYEDALLKSSAGAVKIGDKIMYSTDYQGGNDGASTTSSKGKGTSETAKGGQGTAAFGQSFHGAEGGEVKQFSPPPEKKGILQKLFGIDTDKLYDQGFDSMNKYRERNPDNPRETLQTAGGKLSNLRHGVSTSLLRDAILKKINPGSYEMKEAPPSMNFEELKMSEEGPNKAAKGVASLLAYLGAGTNEIGPGFFSQETMEDLTANLLGLMKTDVYDTPEDKAAMLNEILENDTGGINTYLQSLAPEEKYQEDASLFPPMRQDKMRDQDLLFMKAEEEYEDKVKNLGLGDMDG